MGGLTNSYMPEFDGLMNKVCYSHVVLSISCLVFCVYAPSFPRSSFPPFVSICVFIPLFYLLARPLRHDLRMSLIPSSSSHHVHDDSNSFPPTCQGCRSAHPLTCSDRASSIPLPLCGVLFFLLMTSCTVLSHVLSVFYDLFLLLSILSTHSK
jgi:hypothetical protein